MLRVVHGEQAFALNSRPYTLHFTPVFYYHGLELIRENGAWKNEKRVSIPGSLPFGMSGSMAGIAPFPTHAII